MLRYLTLLVSLGVVFFFSTYFYQVVMYLVEQTGSSWSLAYWIPRMLVIVAAFLFASTVCKLLGKQRKLKWVVSILSFVGLLGTSFAMSPIYQEELSKEGREVSIDEFADNLTIDAINAKYPDFNGVVSIASSTCPHCQLAAKKFSVLKERNPEVDVLFVIYSLDETDITDFKNETGATNFEYMLAPDEKGTLELCNGRFPTFIYLRDKKVIHHWTNNDLGYPAFSWIENGLN